MSDQNSIPKADFNSAISEAISSVKPLLLDLEAKLALLDDQDAIDACATLHAELANQLAIADTLGSTGGMHTDTGGTGKGGAS